MNFIKTDIPDVVIIEPKVFGDDRGYFMETFRKDLFEDFVGFKVNFCQDNESKSKKGVLRGLHYQLPPFAQSKLVRVIKGSVLDVAVDIRKGSPTFGKYVAVELSEENKRQLFIPRGFAHGFLVTSDEAIFAYKVDNYYSVECDRSIRFDDPEIGVNWNFPKNDILISDKDTNAPFLKDADIFAYSEKLY
ncbi:dTDP-4-dehydrorhamnose 3,5-epimerase [Hydrogenimonas thermophila]|uniref:dTDP-4-dehydrorhamnose 3,5-epimerase n=1 Tax=Hydrogenimonas thermophila TaxID=223786 RepID=UPI00293733ED|nr:dTDP-4-dehydrorhamnose 3,5-epimerase [Hydrogenimonas thermophila]WOE69450.1 dTDP-4-dehydrorhamnose 3,5-epimerase [Hydrogenimonas thermophila]WOE71961.1 dTDP-4-dehydrorhamnose 3,5-epimerase [Hydrogenimonas thermophila]